MLFICIHVARLTVGVINVCVLFILCVYLYNCIALFQFMQDKFGDTTLIIASYWGHIECATMLLKHRADIHYQRKVRVNSQKNVSGGRKPNKLFINTFVNQKC